MALNACRGPEDVCELFLVEGLWGKRSDTLPLSECRVEREHRLELWGREGYDVTLRIGLVGVWLVGPIKPSACHTFTKVFRFLLKAITDIF